MEYRETKHAKKRAKDAKMSKYGKKGPAALKEKLGPEGYRKHMSKLAKRGWKLRREREAGEA